MKKCLCVLVLFFCSSLAAQDDDGAWHGYATPNAAHDPINREEPYVEIFWWRHAAHRSNTDSVALMWKWSGGPCVAAWIDGPDGCGAQSLFVQGYGEEEDTHFKPDFVPFTPDSPNQQMRDTCVADSGGGFTMLDAEKRFNWEQFGAHTANAHVEIEVVGQTGESWAEQLEPNFNMANPYFDLDPNMESNARISPSGKMLIEVRNIRWCVAGWMATGKWAMFFQVKNKDGEWEYPPPFAPIHIPFENYEGSAEGWTLRENVLIDQNDPRWPDVLEIRAVVVDWPSRTADPNDCVILYQNEPWQNVTIPKL